MNAATLPQGPSAVNTEVGKAVTVLAKTKAGRALLPSIQQVLEARKAHPLHTMTQRMTTQERRAAELLLQQCGLAGVPLHGVRCIQRALADAPEQKEAAPLGGDALLVLEALRRCTQQVPAQPGGGYSREDITVELRAPETGKGTPWMEKNAFLEAMQILCDHELATSRMPDDPDEPINYILIEKGDVIGL